MCRRHSGKIDGHIVCRILRLYFVFRQTFGLPLLPVMFVPLLGPVMEVSIQPGIGQE
jgi:hypothetical protein